MLPSKTSPWFLLFFLPTLVAGQLAGAPTNSITIHNQGAAQASHPFSISRVFAAGEIRHFARARSGSSLLDTQCDVKTRWPDGSLQHGIISFVAPVPAGKPLEIDFVDQPSGHNDGALSRDAMLALDWTATMELSHGSAQLADARRLLTDWDGKSTYTNVKFWLKGSICTQIVLEDRTPARTYDLGWDEHRSLHPIFVITFYPGYTAGVKVEMILENMWSTKLQDQSYSVTLRAGSKSGPVSFEKSLFKHFARTRWRKVLWSGAQPELCSVDYNLPYLIYSRLLPQFDTDKKVPRESILADYKAVKRSEKTDIWGSGLWTKYMPQTGGREDIGLFPAWYIRYLFTFDPREEEVFTVNAAASGSVPVHLRESDPKATFQGASHTKAFGRSWSLDSHTSAHGTGVGTIADTHGWTPQNAHHGDFAFLPYILTGDWYYLEEVFQWAAWALSTGDPTSEYYGSHGDWGIIPYAAETRGVAWGLRDVAHAAFAAPDGTSEKTYFTEKLNNNIAIREGEQDIRDGAFYDPSPGSKWHWGRFTVGEGTPNPLHFLNRGDEYASLDEMNTSPGSPHRVKWPDGPWQYNYLHVVLGHIEDLGFPVRQLRRTYLTNLLHQILDPAYNPYLVGAYRIPVRRFTTNTFFQSWADVKAGYSASESKAWNGGRAVDVQHHQGWPENDEGDIGHGYPQIAKAAASFLAGFSQDGLDGTKAWQWMVEHVKQTGTDCVDPRWSLVPRRVIAREADHSTARGER